MPSTDNALHTAFYDTNTAATSHQVAISWALAARSGLILGASYDGNTGAQITSITDDAGNTWSCPDATKHKLSNGAGVNLEGWTCLRPVGSPTLITVNFASSVKASIMVAEYAGMLSFGLSTPYDQGSGRILTPTVNTQVRTPGNTPTRSAPAQSIIGIMGWNSALITAMINGTNYVSDGFARNASSNVGVAMNHYRSVAYESEHPSRNGAIANASFRFSDAANMVPAAVMAMTFYREGVFPQPDSQDGIISNIEGVVTVDTSYCFVFMSSPSAPFGGTGFSEKTDTYWSPNVAQYGALPAGVKLQDASFKPFVVDGYDDGLSFAFVLHTSKTDVNGATLTSDDEGRPNASYGTSNYHLLGSVPTATGLKDIPLVVDDEINLTGRTSIRLTMLVDEATTGTYSHPGDHTAELLPAYIRATLVYPPPARSSRPLRLANSPRLTVQRLRR